MNSNITTLRQQFHSPNSSTNDQVKLRTSSHFKSNSYSNKVYSSSSGNDKRFKLRIRRARNNEDKYPINIPLVGGGFKLNSLVNFQKGPLVKMKLKKYNDDSQNKKYEFRKIVGFFDVFKKENQKFYSQDYLKKLGRLLNKKNTDYYVSRKKLEAMSFSEGKDKKVIEALDSDELYITSSAFYSKLNFYKLENEIKVDEGKNRLDCENEGPKSMEDKIVHTNTSNEDQTKLELRDGDDISYFSIDSRVNTSMIREQIASKLDKKFNFFQPENKIMFKNIKNIKIAKKNQTQNIQQSTRISESVKNSYFDDKSQPANNEHKLPQINYMAFKKRPLPKIPNHKSIAFGTVVKKSGTTTANTSKHYPISQAQTANNSLYIEDDFTKHQSALNKITKIDEKRNMKILKMLKDFQL